MKRRDFLKKAGVGSAVAGVALSAAPAVHAKKTRRWKMVTTWPKNFPALGTGANHLAKLITKMSSGEIKVKVYGGGELVPALGIFDAVSQGTAQMGHGASYYWKGKHPATQFFAAVPFGLNADEMIGWIKHGGGQKLWDNLYADFNLKPFAAGNTGVQMGGWFNREINSIEDYKGLKIRMPGLGGEVIKRVGGVVILLPGGELFQSLQSGVIDATEWVGPYNDIAFGFHKAAKYYYWPGWHEPGTVLESFVNREAYEDLPKHLQAIVSAACDSAYVDMHADLTAQNSSSLETLVNKYNVQLKEFSSDILKKMKDISQDVVAEVGREDSTSREIYESFAKFQKHSMAWNRIGEQGFAAARMLT